MGAFKTSNVGCDSKYYLNENVMYCCELTDSTTLLNFTFKDKPIRDCQDDIKKICNENTGSWIANILDIEKWVSFALMKNPDVDRIYFIHQNDNGLLLFANTYAKSWGSVGCSSINFSDENFNDFVVTKGIYFVIKS